MKELSYSDFVSMRKELQANLVIDRDVLDDELIRQPQFMYSVVAYMTKVTARRIQCEEDLKVYDAKAMTTLRALVYNDTKKSLPADALRERLTLQNDRIDKVSELGMWKKEESLWKSLKEAADSKSRSIHDLVTLYKAQYWSSDQ